MHRLWLAIPVLVVITGWLLLRGESAHPGVHEAPAPAAVLLTIAATPPPMITDAAQVLPACSAWFSAVSGLDGMAQPGQDIAATVAGDGRLLLRAGDAWVAVDAQGRMTPCPPDQAHGMHAPSAEEQARAEVAAWRWRTLPDMLPDPAILTDRGDRAAVSARMFDWKVVQPADPSGLGAELTIDPWGAVRSVDLVIIGCGGCSGRSSCGGRGRCVGRSCGGVLVPDPEPDPAQAAEIRLTASN